MKWVRTQFGSVDVDKWRWLECRNCGEEVTDNEHACAQLSGEVAGLIEYNEVQAMINADKPSRTPEWYQAL